MCVGLHVGTTARHLSSVVLCTLVARHVCGARSECCVRWSLGMCMEHGVKYTVYLVSVTRHHYGTQAVDKWDVCRRYSDFHDFHMLLQDKVRSPRIDSVGFGCNVNIQ